MAIVERHQDERLGALQAQQEPWVHRMMAIVERHQDERLGAEEERAREQKLLTELAGMGRDMMTARLKMSRPDVKERSDRGGQSRGWAAASPRRQKPFKLTDREGRDRSLKTPPQGPRRSRRRPRSSSSHRDRRRGRSSGGRRQGGSAGSHHKHHHEDDRDRCDGHEGWEKGGYANDGVEVPSRSGKDGSRQHHIPSDTWQNLSQDAKQVWASEGKAARQRRRRRRQQEKKAREREQQEAVANGVGEDQQDDAWHRARSPPGLSGPEAATGGKEASGRRWDRDRSSDDTGH